MSQEWRLTDVGNAERFASRCANTLRYCHTRKTWYVWNTKYWQRDETGAVERLAKGVVAEMFIEAADMEPMERGLHVRHAMASEKQSRLNAMAFRANGTGTVLSMVPKSAAHIRAFATALLYIANDPFVCGASTLDNVECGP